MEQKDIIEAIDKPLHTTVGRSLSTPWGHASRGTRPRPVVGSAFHAGREKPLENTSQGLGNELGIKKPS